MAQFLYEKIQTLKEAGISAEIPQFLIDGLSTNIVLRDYQKEAIRDTLIYLDSNLSKNKQTHILYHMATGSGKTVIMAMNILHYYSLGYRCFLFFTNQTNIISKTKKNFLESLSSKYLFAEEIIIAGQRVPIKEVDNFQDIDENAINICFNTVQGLHSGLTLIREGSITIEDFEDRKIVLIADEAHHLNSTTARDRDENELNETWEDTVNRILFANRDNVLLEYTATCDIQDANVRNKYLDKIVFNFDLRRFREAGYTKEFANLQSNNDKFGKTLQAIVMSEYRKLLFEKNNVSIKPVVLLKSKMIRDSNDFYKEFYQKLASLTAEQILSIKMSNVKNELFVNAFRFFEDNNISLDILVDLIKLDFAMEHSVNMNVLSKENEDIVNNLDEKDNHYRLIFIVDKLTEGWDVLSLFDIVRLYETRQGGAKGTVSKYTNSEAQLIGRGARYCPFKFDDGQQRDKRKYSDYANSNAICETLLYHCMQDSRYIQELNKALKATGLLPEKEVVTVEYQLKDSFRKTRVYLEGYVFLNDRIEISRDTIHSLPDKIRLMPISYKCTSGVASFGMLMDDAHTTETISLKDLEPVKFGDIEKNIVYKAFRCFANTLSFDKIKKQFPHLRSVREFLFDENYLGEIPITFFASEGQLPSMDDKLNACKAALQTVSDYVQKIEVSYKGTHEFKGYPIHEKFTNKIRNITRSHEDESWGEGVSQASSLVNSSYRIDLSDKEWFVYNDNYGTSEEKKFVKYFSTKIEELKQTFTKIFLIRNELQVCIFSFDDGSKFEPDYVLILNKEQENKDDLYICMFIEPKGEHLLEKDLWKGNLLMQLEEKGVPVVRFADDNEYLIWGAPLYNENRTKRDFVDYFDKLIASVT